MASKDGFEQVFPCTGTPLLASGRTRVPLFRTIAAELLSSARLRMEMNN
jgi:hypothetical protein